MTHADPAEPQRVQTARDWRMKLAAVAVGLALLALFVLFIAALGSRFGLWSWQFGLLTLTSQVAPFLLIGAAVTGLVALIAGFLKAPRKRVVMVALFALLLTGMTFGRTAAIGMQAGSLPLIHDVTTDLDDPVRFGPSILEARAETDANVLWDQPGYADGPFDADVPALQREAMPDCGTEWESGDTPYPPLCTLELPGIAPDSALRLASGLAERRGWAVMAREDGRIDAVHTSRWYGFKDDIAIRVRALGGDASAGSEVDMRSASRVGLSDLGANSKRVYSFLNDLRFLAGEYDRERAQREAAAAEG